MNQLAAGHHIFGLGAFAVSDDTNLLAYTTTSPDTGSTPCT